MKTLRMLPVVAALCLSPNPAQAVTIDLGLSLTIPAQTPFFFSLPAVPVAGDLSVDFVLDGVPAHIEFLQHTNLTLHVNESAVDGNSVPYDFVLTDMSGTKILGTERDAADLGGFLSGSAAPPPTPIMDEIDPSQLEEERYFHGVAFALPALADLDPLANGFNAALLFDQDVSLGLWVPVPEPSSLTALSSLLLVVAGTLSCRRRRRF